MFAVRSVKIGSQLNLSTFKKQNLTAKIKTLSVKLQALACRVFRLTFLSVCVKTNVVYYLNMKKVLCFN